MLGAVIGVLMVWVCVGIWGWGYSFYGSRREE